MRSIAMKLFQTCLIGYWRIWRGGKICSVGPLPNPKRGIWKIAFRGNPKPLHRGMRWARPACQSKHERMTLLPERIAHGNLACTDDISGAESG
jgi:hypothetical protein